MAQYYNIVPNPNGSFTIEDLQQICSIDGQNVQFVLEDVNHGSNVISQPILAYAAPSDSSEQALFSQSTINLGAHVATTQLEPRQSVYIIKTNEPSIQPNIYSKTDSGNTRFQGSKDQLNICYTPAQSDWLTTRDNNESFELVIKKESSPVKTFTPNPRTQQQISTTQTSPSNIGVQDSLFKKPTRLISINKRQTIANPPVGILKSTLQSPNTQTAKVGKMKRNPAVANNPNISVTSRSRTSTGNVSTNQLSTPPRTPQARPPIHSEASQRNSLASSKNVPPLHYPEMSHLSERIKQATLKQRQSNNERQLQKQQPVMAVTPMPRTAQSTQSPVQRQRGRGQMLNRQQMQMQQQQLLQRQQVAAAAPVTQQTRLVQASTMTETIEQPMEVDSSENTEQSERLNQQNNTAKSCTKESLAYLQQEIEDPHTAIVQQQIAGNEAKMLVILENLEQRLITFEVPKEDCTVQDLLEQVTANIMSAQDPRVSLVCDPTLGINYIVDLSPTACIEEDQNIENTPNVSVNVITNVVTTVESKTPVKNNTTNLSSASPTISPRSFYKKSEPSLPQKPEREAVSKRGRGRGRAVSTRLVKEPECLTISSDEEDDNRKQKRPEDSKETTNALGSQNIDESDTILEKEPVITNNSVLPTAIKQLANSQIPPSVSSGKEQGTISNPTTSNLNTYLTCRTVRIGSYKYIPNDKILISSSGLKLEVPLLEDEKSSITVEIKPSNLVKVLIHFAKSMPVLFFYTNVDTGSMIRDLLGMQDPKGPYFDPASRDHTHKRITLLPEKIMDDSKNILKELYKPIFEELNSKEANDILVKASPKSKVQTSIKTRSSTSSNSNGVIQTITVYPPPPAKGGIAINTEDFICLGEDQFLNDVIIDFYLKYLMLEILSKEDHNRTHVFSSYFYKRLTSPHTQATGNTENLSKPARRHARVQKWTKNVNIFEKDFIVIPINEHAHWFLAIVCFPGLVGTVLSVNTKPETKPENQKCSDKKKKDAKMQALTIGNTTITPVSTITIDTNDDGSERDEAEGDDEEMESDSDDDDEDELESKSGAEQDDKISNQVSQNNEIHKVPCVLIFDSLNGPHRNRVVATLRDYLSCEYQAKMGSEKIFTKDTMRGSCLKVPQQSNFTDCGLYVLQYVESFFQTPIMDYTAPIKPLRNWFEEIVVTRKREEIANLLTVLVNNTKGNKTISLPNLTFPTQDGKLKQKSESSPETKTGKTDNENKKKSTETVESKSNDTTSSADENEGSSNDLSSGSATSPTIPPLTNQVSSTSDSNLIVQKDSTTAVTTRSSADTMAFLKNKRIPRLQKSSDNQEDKQVAKKHKGDSFDSCK